LLNWLDVTTVRVGRRVRRPSAALKSNLSFTLRALPLRGVVEWLLPSSEILENTTRRNLAKPKGTRNPFSVPHLGEIMRIGRLVAAISTAIALTAAAFVAGGGAALASAMQHA
jgi:hypothetical protein